MRIWTGELKRPVGRMMICPYDGYFMAALQTRDLCGGMIAGSRHADEEKSPDKMSTAENGILVMSLCEKQPYNGPNTLNLWQLRKVGDVK